MEGAVERSVEWKKGREWESDSYVNWKRNVLKTPNCVGRRLLVLSWLLIRKIITQKLLFVILFGQ